MPAYLVWGLAGLAIILIVAGGGCVGYGYRRAFLADGVGTPGAATMLAFGGAVALLGAAMLLILALAN